MSAVVNIPVFNRSFSWFHYMELMSKNIRPSSYQFHLLAEHELEAELKREIKAIKYDLEKVDKQDR
jgi:hypothetical protein